MNAVKCKWYSLKLCLFLLAFSFLLVASMCVSVFCQPLQPFSTLVYTRPNGRIGDIALTASGELVFTNYPTKPGRVWGLSQRVETLVYEVSKSAQDVYGIAVSKDGDVYLSSPYTGEILRLASKGGVFMLYMRSSKNVGPMALAPNGTLYFAELIPSEGYQSVYRLVPAGAVTATGSMVDIPVYTAPVTIGGIAFNSRGELFFSDGSRGRLWKVVNGTSVLYVDKRGWSSMYGIVFDQFDNLYFCDWSSPGNIYYLDFRLELVYRVIDGNKVPLGGATVSVDSSNDTKISLKTNSTGHVLLKPAWPGNYSISVFWKNVSVGSFSFKELVNVKRDLKCKVFNVKLTAKDSSARPLSDCFLNIELPNGSSVVMKSPAFLPTVPAGILVVSAFYNDVRVAGPVSMNLTSNIDASIECAVHSLSVSIIDSSGNLVRNSSIVILSEDSVVANQSFSSGSITLDNLLSGEYVITAWLKGVQVAGSRVFLNSSKSTTLTANVTDLSLKARDFLGFPMQGAKVLVTFPDNSNVSGYVDEKGEYSLSQIPATSIMLLVDTGVEKRILSLQLNKGRFEASTVFLVSTSTVVLTIVVLIVIVVIVPQTRRELYRLVKAIPVEVSFEPEAQDLATQYYNFLSSTQRNVEEAIEVKGGEARIIVAGNGILPHIRGEDHVAFLLSDTSFTPSRREVRLLKELTDLNSDLASLSKLVHVYSERTGLRAVGILVCDEVTDGMLNSLKEIKVEVAYIKRKSLQA